jgi:hypothetical protein
LVAGINFDLTGMGVAISGQYHIPVSTHVVSGDGAYTTSLEIRQTGSIPKPRAVPKISPDKTDQYDPNNYDLEETEQEDNS